jgi:hypothetical protein
MWKMYRTPFFVSPVDSPSENPLTSPEVQRVSPKTPRGSYGRNPRRDHQKVKTWRNSNVEEVCMGIHNESL